MNVDLHEKNTRNNYLESKITSSKAFQKQLFDQINEMQQLKQDLDGLLNNKRTGLLQEISILKQLFALDDTTYEGSLQNTKKPDLIIRNGNSPKYLAEEFPEEIKKLNDIYSLLLDNLPQPREDEDKQELRELSKFISASYICHLPLLFVGNSANDMARIISISFNNQLPDKICVPTGYNNYSSLLNVIKKLKSDIVVLENVVGCCDEYCYTHLAEDIPDKYFIFLVEYEEILKLLPKGIYAHMGLIKCDKFFKNRLMDDEQPDPGKVTFSISSSFDISTRKMLLGKLLKLTPDSPISTGYVNSRVKILETIIQKEDDKILKVIYTELISILEIYGRSEEYNAKLINSADPIVKEFRARLGVETE